MNLSKSLVCNETFFDNCCLACNKMSMIFYAEYNVYCIYSFKNAVLWLISVIFAGYIAFDIAGCDEEVRLR